MCDDPEIIGDWERERVLGCGGFGIVVLWRNCKSNDRIAIKKYRGENDNLTKKHKDRWTQEVEMMKRIDNVNIVRFQSLPPELELSKCNPSKLPMLSMEFCTKGDLRNVLVRSENCCGLLESDVRYILTDLMNAVSYLHNMDPKITHRDLKPENIVLQTCDRPNGIIYKLIDLGYAKELDAKSICASFVGTLQYLAPELLYSKTYSCSVDYWSMGLVAFEIICGTRPFLPNMSPAQWMFHVRKKSSNDICIYQENESPESIKYSETIFDECRVSSCFKREIEQWLRLALEFIPKKRGYLNNEATGTTNELAIFTSLKTLLDKKIITAFCAYTREYCSYEIDDFTRVDTLQGWIQRDTKINKADQQLLSVDCNVIDSDELAVKYFDKTYRHPMLYVFHKSEMFNNDITLKYRPESVQDMFTNSSTPLQYHFQKRAYAHALYFIWNETNQYNSLLDAFTQKIHRMLQICDVTVNMCKAMQVRVEQMRSQKEFSKHVLEFDCKQYLKNYSQNANHWLETFNSTVERSEKLEGVCKQLIVRQESATRRTQTLGNAFGKEFSSDNNHDLNTLLDDAMLCYEAVRNRSKEKRSTPESCKKMTKIVYNVLKSRDKLLRDTNFLRCLQMITSLETELDKLIPPLNSAMEHIEQYQKEFLADHLARQTKIWEFTIKQKLKSTNTETSESAEPKPVFLLGNPVKSNDDYGPPVSLDKPLHFILGDGKHSSIESNSSYHSTSELPSPSKHVSLEHDTVTDQIHVENSVTNTSLPLNDNHSCSELPVVNVQETPAIFDLSRDKTLTNVPSVSVPHFLIGAPASDMININTSLRYELQEKTNESFIKCKSILGEQFDFSFLKE
ncbi:I-kappaB kinase beta [Carabus blaptoides fortunei]